MRAPIVISAARLLKANVIYTDMNPCGGAERLTLATMHALSQKCVNFDLTTCIQPNMTKLEMHTVAKSLLFFRKQKK